MQNNYIISGYPALVIMLYASGDRYVGVTFKQMYEKIQEFLENPSIEQKQLPHLKIYKMEGGRWLITDYTDIPDTIKHYIDSVEGSTCSLNVRIISNSTLEILEKNMEIFDE